MDIFEFMGNHPVLTFFLAAYTCATICFVVGELLHQMNIWKHGWPPIQNDETDDEYEYDVR